MADEKVKCCHKRCSWDVVPGTTRCDKHTDHHRKEVAARQKLNISLGNCRLCGREAVKGKTSCEDHDTCMGVRQCGICREYGHNRITCIKRKQVVKL